MFAYIGNANLGKQLPGALYFLKKKSLKEVILAR